MKPQIDINKIKKLKLPIFSIPDTPLATTTQDFLSIADISDNLIIHRDGGVSLVLESTSLNFGLLSENEQEAVIAAYAALINSLSFSIQIIVHSQRKDISNYLKYLDENYEKIINPKLKSIMVSYKNFIAETVKKKNVLGKRFFIVIYFSPLELGIAKSAMSVAKRGGTLPYTKSYVIKKAKIALYPRRDHLIRQAGRLGLRLKQLESNEIAELLYEYFNPVVVKTGVSEDEEIEKGEKNESK